MYGWRVLVYAPTARLYAVTLWMLCVPCMQCRIGYAIAGCLRAEEQKCKPPLRIRYVGGYFLYNEELLHILRPALPHSLKSRINKRSAHRPHDWHARLQRARLLCLRGERDDARGAAAAGVGIEARGGAEGRGDALARRGHGGYGEAEGDAVEHFEGWGWFCWLGQVRLGWVGGGCICGVVVELVVVRWR